MLQETFIIISRHYKVAGKKMVLHFFLWKLYTRDQGRMAYVASFSKSSNPLIQHVLSSSNHQVNKNLNKVVKRPRVVVVMSSQLLLIKYWSNRQPWGFLSCICHYDLMFCFNSFMTQVTIIQRPVHRFALCIIGLVSI